MVHFYVLFWRHYTSSKKKHSALNTREMESSGLILSNTASIVLYTTTLFDGVVQFMTK